MAGAIAINILSNVREAVRGVDNVADALEDAEGRMRDLTKEGDTASDRMEADFRKTAQAADAASDKARSVWRQFFRGLGGDSDDATQKVKGGFDEVKSEASQSGREAAASFSGGFDDIGDFIQETIANGLGGFGPAGAAAGIAIAAVIGTVMANAQQAQEKLEEARGKAAELASTMYENGGQIPLTDRVEELLGLLSSERLARNPIERIADDFVDLGTNLDMVREAARNLDVPLSDVIGALTGSDLDKTKSMLRAAREELERINEESGSVNLEDWQSRKDAVSGLVTELESLQKQGELANDLYNSTEFLNAKGLEEQAARVADLSGMWQNAAADAATYFSETEDGATSFDWSAYLADSEATIAAADEMKARLVGMPESIRAEAERVFAAQGAVAANEYTKAYEGASATDKGRFESAARANGEAAGAAQAQGLKDAFGNPVIDAKIKVSVDDKAWRDFSPSAKTGWIKGVPQPV